VPINLNREPRPGAIKIEHIVSDWVLTTKDGLIRRADTQALPELCFQCGQGAEAAEPCWLFLLAPSYWKPPPPCFAWSPSPASRGRTN